MASRAFFRGAAATVLLTTACGLGLPAQTTALTLPATPLLPASFGEWSAAAAAPEGSATPAFSLANANKAALEECSPQRSAVAEYTHAGTRLHVEAIQFDDRSGAYSAFTMLERPGMVTGKALGGRDAVGNGAVLVQTGSTVVLAQPATAADVASLQPLAAMLPKVTGNKGVAPLLPSFAPAQHLVDGSLRYALGPATYAAEGGVLPARSLGWEKSAEGVTALYAGKQGGETLTLLLYPTPQIAGAFARAIEGRLGGMGPSFATAKVRHEHELVMLASGSYSAAAAQDFLGGIHMKQELSIDKDVQPIFHVEVQKTASLLANIAVLSGVLMLAAVLLGFFLGGGRALVRKLRGKSASVEPEFLSLHLAPQNKAPEFRS